MSISKEELLKFKNHFLTEKLIIQENQKNIHKKLLIDKEELSDEIDLISCEQQKSFDLRMQKRTDQFLNKINNSLSKIDEGTFGICDECSESIDFKRLQARPTCTLCIECKENEEKNEYIFSSNQKRHLRVI